MEKVERFDHKGSIVGVGLVVVKAVRAPLVPAFLRGVLASAAEEPAVAGVLGRALGSPGFSAELTVRITGEREMRRLNRAFLAEDHTTDVLSFPSGDPASGYLGDLAMSWPAVLRQSAAYGHEPETEAAVLLVHGFLHLLGWDHATRDQEHEMTELTLACLARAGVRPAASRL